MSENGKELTIVNPGELYRVASDVAGVCGAIVKQTAVNIQGRRYCKCEGWMSIAAAHGCTASVRFVEHVEGGIRAIADLIRHRDGMVIASAEGFVGEDEPKWANGPEYARRAMAQTRAISRVCRSAFAHVVVLIDAGLSTTPLEEVPDNGFIEDRQERREAAANGNVEKVASAWKTVRDAKPDRPRLANEWPADTTVVPTDDPKDWRDVQIHFGKNKGLPLGELTSRQLSWYAEEWVQKKTEDTREPSPEDRKLVEALLQFQRSQKEGIQQVKETVAGKQALEIQESNEQAAEAEPLPF